MTTYQYQQQPQQQQQHQSPSGLGYICCVGGSPWDDIWGSSNETNTPVKSPPQDFNNPFSHFEPDKRSDESLSTNRSPYTDARSVASHTVTGQSVAGHSAASQSVASQSTAGLSIGTRRKRTPPSKKNTDLDGKTLRDVEREDKAKSRALKLQEALSSAGQQPKTHAASVLASDYAAHKFELRQKGQDKDISKKTSRVNAAVQAIKDTRKHIEAVGKTETTRPQRPLTADDMRDTESVSGMKGHNDIELEEEARKKGLYMISSGQYHYDEKAGVALWTSNDRNNNIRKTSGNVQEIV